MGFGVYGLGLRVRVGAWFDAHSVLDFFVLHCLWLIHCCLLLRVGGLGFGVGFVFGIGFEVQGLGFGLGVCVLGFRVWGSWLGFEGDG